MNTIGERVRAVREFYKMSQTEFADKLLVKQGLLSHIEVNRRAVSTNMLRKLNQIFQVSNDWVMLGVGDMFDGEPKVFAKGELQRKSLTDYDTIKIITETLVDCINKRGEDIDSSIFAKLLVEYYKYYVEEQEELIAKDLRKIIEQSYVMTSKLVREQK